MPRYVILIHDWPVLHWDFLLEAGPVLHAWRLAGEPGENTIIPAERIADHRLLYLDYEGPVSGDRGTVTRFDAGDYESADGGTGDRYLLRKGRINATVRIVPQDGAKCRFEFSSRNA